MKATPPTQKALRGFKLCSICVCMIKCVCVCARWSHANRVTVQNKYSTEIGGGEKRKQDTATLVYTLIVYVEWKEKKGGYLTCSLP